MTAYFSGPYLVSIEYFTPIGSLTLKHTQRLNCAAVGTPSPGDAATSILLQTAGGGTKTLATAIAEYWAFFREGIPTATTVTLANFWAVTPGSDDLTFITSVALTPTTGANTTAPQPAREETLTYRSAKGSYMAIDLLEGAGVIDTQVPLVPAAVGNWTQVLSYYILSAGGWIACRDRSFPIAPMRYSGTQNEATYRKRFRQS